MRHALSFLSTLSLSFLSFVAYGAEDGNAILGTWFNEEKDSHIVVYAEEDNDGVRQYFGKIVFLYEPNYAADDEEAGKPKHDRLNKDKSLRGTPIIGLILLKDFVFNEKSGAWDQGTIYDPNVGKTYKCVVKMVDDKAAVGGSRLDIRGYIGVPAFGRTTVWTRVPSETLKETQDV